MSKSTKNAIAQDAPYFEFNFNHCTLVQYIFGSIIEFNWIRRIINTHAPTIHNGGNKNPHQNNYPKPLAPIIKQKGDERVTKAEEGGTCLQMGVYEGLKIFSYPEGTSSGCNGIEASAILYP